MPILHAMTLGVGAPALDHLFILCYTFPVKKEVPILVLKKEVPILILILLTGESLQKEAECKSLQE